MCGICGIFKFGDTAPVDQAEVKHMADTMAHRGPDDCGTHVNGSLGLGFRRLSIIDLAGGHQPMSDKRGELWVVFNGEIYNFKELRNELQGHGHVFRTNCDTEVIVYGYKQWGIDVLQHLNGMFGLAIWDQTTRQLMLARDRMGIKLIYYTFSANRLAFGSEIRPLLACMDDHPLLDPEAVSLFLQYRYTPSPATVLKGIKKLAPGTRLVVKQGSQPVVERWWNFRPTPFERMPKEQDAEEELLALYKRAVKRQLVSDVPLGLLLSGGLDSGLLLALMSEGKGLYNTYTVGYGQSFAEDELSSAADTARAFGVPNFSVEIGRDSFEQSLPTILTSLEEPVATSSVVPMYHVCKRAREDVKVALMGQGPDELFGGYTRHLGIHYGGYWRSLPGTFQRAVGALATRFSSNEAVQRGLYSLGATDRFERYRRTFAIVPDTISRDLFHVGILQESESRDRFPVLWREMAQLAADTDELGGLQFLEIRSSLPDELLMYADKMSMAHGLEVRVPFLDQEIVEYVERLDATFKVRNGTRKWLHRRVCNRLLPKSIVRRPKAGFAVNVVDKWFRDSLSKQMDDVLLDRCSYIYRYLRPQAVLDLLCDHRAKKRDNHKILFSLIVLEHFAQSVAR